MKGYNTDIGYMGYIPGEGYSLFSCERDYIEIMESEENGNED